MTASPICRRFASLVVALTVAATVSLSACAVSKEDYIDAVDEFCAKVNLKFATELSLAGEEFGTSDDLDKLAERTKVLKDLRREVDKLEIPKGTARADDWLAKVDAYIKETQRLWNGYRYLPAGGDLYWCWLSASTTTLLWPLVRPQQRSGSTPAPRSGPGRSSPNRAR